MIGAIQEGANKMAYIPSPFKYDKTIDWNKNFPSANYGKFLRTERYMLSDDIEIEAKKKVKMGGKNPGPASHHNEKSWLKSS